MWWRHNLFTMSKTISIDAGLSPVEIMLAGKGFKVISKVTFSHAQSGKEHDSVLWHNHKLELGVEVSHAAGSCMLCMVKQGVVAEDIKRQDVTAPFRTFYTNPEVLWLFIAEMANLAVPPTTVFKEVKPEA